jgi:hypothetical protein
VHDKPPRKQVRASASRSSPLAKQFLRGRQFGLYTLPALIVFFMAFGIPKYPTWEWIYPGACVVVATAGAFMARTARTLWQLAFWILLDLVVGIAGLVLLTVPLHW